jgi:hypothetical protein
LLRGPDTEQEKESRHEQARAWKIELCLSGCVTFIFFIIFFFFFPFCRSGKEDEKEQDQENDSRHEALGRSGN